MSDYRRYFVRGGTYFFTVVTERRASLFADEKAREILGNVLRESVIWRPFKVLAIVLLPDHLHAIWQLPAGDDKYDIRWNWIKRQFTMRWLRTGGREQRRRRSRIRERRRGIWQRRYWEHLIDDEYDLENHVDYMHYNPVKHGYVKRPRDWPESSFHRWSMLGHYDLDWGRSYIPVELPGNAGE
ncbi:REP-associated tyrosine transposase [Anatilimnocola floriformis]|uniref:REP-associated tyrosine transposase n=1 Tax=Anatilimnocola floriformis TaxID=2948575 RepID=UPI0020C4022D|nr:transposase [Anatilimnocola floriformis]